MPGIAFVFLAASATLAAEATQVKPTREAQALEIMARGDYQGGLVVHLGCGDGQLTAALHRGGGAIVQGLDVDAGRVAAARESIRQSGTYGKVSADVFDATHLPYADNLVNLVVVSDQFSVDRTEMLRVLCPGGAAVVLASDRNASAMDRLVKPWPDAIDEWTHYLYDASGNAVSRDRRVDLPQRLQWDGEPRWSRSHETDMSVTAVVSAGGRIIHTVDDGPIGVHETPRDKRQLPDKCSLVARDAFNGIQLWKRPISDWGSAAWDDSRWRFGVGDQLWSSPLTLPRRLVAAGDRVYVTLGFLACVSELDAATGKTLREFPQTEFAKEILLSQNILVARTGDAASSPAGNESIVAVDMESGELLWRETVKTVADLTLAVADGRVCFHDTEKLVAIDLRTGKTLWETDSRLQPRRKATAGTLVMARDMVLFARPIGVQAYRASDGRLLWNRKTNTSFRGMPDLFVIDDLAWSGTLTTTGLDLLTGEVSRQIDPGHLYTGGHHVRCYRGKATEDFLLWSKRGVEFLDLHSDGHMRHDWVRGTCRYGILPANGLLYAPPHPCFCYPGVKLTGFNALAPAPQQSPSSADRTPTRRLERGPAYDPMRPSSTDANLPPAAFGLPSPTDWPTYRHDNARSGSTVTEISPRLKQAWTTKLQGKVTPPVVVGERLFVAEVDSHCVMCLDTSSGTQRWNYTTGGPVDSPPTVHGGRVVFGCTDGFVYCLRADDGELAWRFQAAPSSRRIMSYGRLESAWPVHGSVLVENGIAYVVAGRSSYLDGGIYLYGLDLATGEIRHQTHLDGPAPDLSVPSDRAHEMDGSKNDILVSNGGKLFLTQNVFDLQLNQIESPKIAKWGARKTDLHLVATGGFLDDSGFDRLYWMYAERWPGLYVAVDTSKAGQILVFDDKTTYGLHTFNTKFGRSPYFAPGAGGHELFADDNTNEPVLSSEAARRERGTMSRSGPPKWSVTIPVRARAMVLAGETLFLAGPPDVIDPDDPYGAFEGRKGGRLWAVSTANGEKIAEYELDSPPVFDGIIAAQQKLFIITEDGCVTCWK